MNIKPIPDGNETIACAVCLDEIPGTAMKSEEASDYVHHFCGLECFAGWRAQEDRQDAGEDIGVTRRP